MSTEGAKTMEEGGWGELELLLGLVWASKASLPLPFALGDTGQPGSGFQRLVPVGEIAGELQPHRTPTLPCPARQGLGAEHRPCLCPTLFWGWFF